jgi:hypothetical protein
MWATSWRTSHAVQSVGRVQSSGWSASTASVTRWYSVCASRIAVGLSIPGWMTLGPGQVVAAMIISCSWWRGSADRAGVVGVRAGFVSAGRGEG